jgi:hypothetical protein
LQDSILVANGGMRCHVILPCIEVFHGVVFHGVPMIMHVHPISPP